jgi:ABC-type nitrate/sulfonate/bicarbonate transport system ATPase subunit
MTVLNSLPGRAGHRAEARARRWPWWASTGTGTSTGGRCRAAFSSGRPSPTPSHQPQVLLLGEPFAADDAQTRADLEDLLLDVWQRTALTVLFVTHDIDEAAYLANRIVVLSASPTRAKETITVDLPRPRDQIVTKEVPEFAHLRARVFASIKGESSRRPAAT